MAAQDTTTTTTTGINRNRCCFNYFPCFGPTPQPPSSSSTSSSSSSASLWESPDNNKWWSRPVQALKKIREWSEIVAGPKWKTFIRRFNRKSRHHHHHHHGHVSTGKFNYDPLSYALNFDQGHQGQNGHFDDEWVHSAPSAAVPASVKLAVVV